MTAPPHDDPLRSALFTDLYELTMAQAYAAENLRDVAVFELFFRSLPESRNYVVAAGLEDVLDYLEGFQFTADDIQYLRSQQRFSTDFLQQLKSTRFTGDVYAVPEGTVVFANEPLVQVVGPIMEAQLVETLVVNQVHFQSLAATKASRVVAAAAGRMVVDFGSRRAHGTDAALKVARSGYLAGMDGTSLVLAGKQYGIPIYGTMAHSYIQAHADETQAFLAFARQFPQSTMLVDTYDSLAAVRRVIELSRTQGDAFVIRAIRLDSGDLLELAKASRKLLDDAGLQDVHIFASSELDERKVHDLLTHQAPIDGFGVGTQLAVCADAPSLDMAYKLVAYAHQPRMKLSTHKVLYPGRKQVYRQSQGGRMVRDVLSLHDEPCPGERLLKLVMRQGIRLPDATPRLAHVREYARRQWEQLPEPLRQLTPQRPGHEVVVSVGLEQARRQLQRALGGRSSC